MDKSQKDDQQKEKLQISFPRSDQDKKLQLVDINGSIFALVFAPLESKGPIKLDCKDWSLILLSPIKSNADVAISAINVLCFNEIDSQDGTVNLQASNLLLKFAPTIKKTEKINEKGARGTHNLSNDPASFVHYYKLYEAIISATREGTMTPEVFLELQQKFLLSLCAIAAQFEKEKENLTLKKVLSLWGIKPQK